jgi:hypothetical protein
VYYKTCLEKRLIIKRIRRKSDCLWHIDLWQAKGLKVNAKDVDNITTKTKFIIVDNPSPDLQHSMISPVIAAEL